MSRAFNLLTLLSIIIQNECANILAVFPAPSISHQVVFRPITQELAKKGHSVTVVTPDPIFKVEKFGNLTEIDLHDVSYAFKDEIYGLANAKNILIQVENFCILFFKIFEAQLQTKVLKNLFNDKSKKFDVIITEALYQNALAFSHVFKAPVIQLSSFGTIDPNNFMVGSLSHPVFYPTSSYQRKCHKHTLWDRLVVLYNQFMLARIYEKCEKKGDIMLKKIFSDIPSLSELRNNVELLMINVHPIWENNRPVPPNVIYLGGLPQQPDKQLPKVDMSGDYKKGVVTSSNIGMYVYVLNRQTIAQIHPNKMEGCSYGPKNMEQCNCSNDRARKNIVII